MKLETIYQQWNMQTSLIDHNIIPFDEVLEIARARWNIAQACQLDPITGLSHDYMNKVSFIVRYIEMFILWMSNIEKLRESLSKMEYTNYRKNYKLYWIKFDNTMNQKIKKINTLYNKIRKYKWPILGHLFLINNFLETLWINTQNIKELITTFSKSKSFIWIKI